jgi:hypothetical protein
MQNIMNKKFHVSSPGSDLRRQAASGGGLRTIVMLCGAAAGIAAVCLYFGNVTLPLWHQDTLLDVVSALCLARFGADEHGVRLPLVALEGLGDFKPPIFIYLNALVFLFFKPSAVAARVVSLLLGLGGVTAATVFAKRLVSPETYRLAAIPFFCFGLLSTWVLGGHFFACSPALAVVFAALLIWASRNIMEQPGSWSAGLAFGLATAAMPYGYFTMKFFFLVNTALVTAIVGARAFIGGFSAAKVKGLLLGIALAVAAGIPHLLEFFSVNQSLYRARQVIESDPGRIVATFFTYFNPVFLFLQTPPDMANASGYGGAVNLVFLPFVACGLWACLRRGLAGSPFHVYLPLFLLAAFVPASLTRPAFAFSNLHRTMIAFPAIFLLAFLGAERIMNFFAKRGVGAVAAIFTVIVCTFGGFEALKNVRQFHRTMTVCVNWSSLNTLLAIPPSWDVPERLFACEEYQADSAFYRYYRMIEKNDLCYCKAGRAAGQKP